MLTHALKKTGSIRGVFWGSLALGLLAAVCFVPTGPSSAAPIDQVRQGGKNAQGQRRDRGQRDRGQRRERGQSRSRGQQGPRPPRNFNIERTPIHGLVDQLDIERFKSNIKTLAGFGTRYWNTEGNEKARDWIAAELESYGYEVTRQKFTASGRDGRGEPKEVENIYVTKVGTVHPDQMYIISAHMDSFNTESVDQSFAPGANDDGSGTSIVMEAARIFASPDVETEISIRFALWNCEEIGLVGSQSYVEQRRELQGIEEPPGSGLYPEPKWLGVIQHDMMMFDHGMPRQQGEPPAERQIRDADVDIEYDADSTFNGGAILLASKLLAANVTYATDYPAEVGQFMQSTDSVPFIEFCPAITLRENERRNEIGRGGDPQWHKNSDVYETYSDEDFRLGFNALQMTTGAIAELAGLVGSDR